MTDMESDTHVSPHQSPSMRKALLILSCIVHSIVTCGTPLVMRLYFIHGGNRVWLSSCLLSAGWPLILVILIVTFYYRRASTTKLFNMKPRLIVASTVLGILTGVGNYLYAYGIAKLLVSTSVLLVASQLAFTAGFAFLFVKQKFSPFSINAVVLLTVGSGVLALHTNTDRPDGESKREYILGFVMTLGASVLWGFILPLIELAYQKAKQAIPREARNFDLGETKYYMILVSSAMLSQFFILGAGRVALVLSLWGFVSFFLRRNKTVRTRKRIAQLIWKCH